MDLRELRVGNLVQNKNGDVFEIDNVSESGVNGMSWTDTHYGNISGGFDYMYTSEEVFGVPITEEKLLEFGFDNEEGWCLPYGEFGYFELYNHGNGLWYQSVNGGEYTIGKAMKFIHELQNRFYSISGEELTIKQ